MKTFSDRRKSSHWIENILQVSDNIIRPCENIIRHRKIFLTSLRIFSKWWIILSYNVKTFSDRGKSSSPV
jgi:hypothetical protein